MKRRNRKTRRNRRKRTNRRRGGALRVGVPNGGEGGPVSPKFIASVDNLSPESDVTVYESNESNETDPTRPNPNPKRSKATISKEQIVVIKDCVDGVRDMLPHIRALDDKMTKSDDKLSDPDKQLIGIAFTTFTNSRVDPQDPDFNDKIIHSGKHKNIIRDTRHTLEELNMIFESSPFLQPVPQNQLKIIDNKIGGPADKLRSQLKDKFSQLRGKLLGYGIPGLHALPSNPLNLDTPRPGNQSQGAAEE